MIRRAQERSRFYEALAVALDAGLTLEQALATQGQSREATTLRGADGDGLTRAVEAAPELFREFERAMIRAGEESGRLPTVLRRLARSFETQAQALTRLAAGLLYPTVVVHGAILLPPLFYLFRDGFSAYLGVVLPPLFALWIAAGLLYALRGRSFVARLPGLGRALRAAALSRFAEVFAALYGAGAPIPSSLRQAARAADHPRFQHAGKRAADAIQSGATLTEAFASDDVFPPLFIESVRVGETAGNLDEALERSADAARAESERALKATAAAVSVFVYLLAAVAVAWIVIGFFRGYGETLSGIG